MYCSLPLPPKADNARRRLVPLKLSHKELLQVFGTLECIVLHNSGVVFVCVTIKQVRCLQIVVFWYVPVLSVRECLCLLGWIPFLAVCIYVAFFQIYIFVTYTFCVTSR